VARQVSEAGLLKHPHVVTTLEPFAGKLNMVTTSGPLWKKWRVAFNPGFSATHLIAQVPMMVDCCQEFIKALDGHASANRLFRMEEEVTFHCTKPFHSFNTA
jgi:cytochrome P450